MPSKKWDFTFLCLLLDLLLHILLFLLLTLFYLLHLLTLLFYLLFRLLLYLHHLHLLLFMQTNRGVLYKPRLSMRAKLVISYANGGAGSFRGKVCLKSRVHVLPTGDISCPKYFDPPRSLYPSSLQMISASPIVICSS